MKDLVINEIVLEGDFVKNKTIQLFNTIGDIMFNTVSTESEFTIDTTLYGAGSYMLKVGDVTRGILIY